MIEQILISIAEPVILTGTPITETNSEIETQTLTAETKTRKCSK